MNRTTRSVVGKFSLADGSRLLDATIVRYVVETTGEPRQTVYRFVAPGVNVGADTSGEAIRLGLSFNRG